MGCVILTRKLFNLLKNKLIFFSPLIFRFFFFFLMLKSGRTGRSGSDATVMSHRKLTETLTSIFLRKLNALEVLRVCG